jgi:hypothetical protein
MAAPSTPRGAPTGPTAVTDVDADLVAGALQVVGDPAEPVGAGRHRHAANPPRWIACGGDRAARLVGVLDHRDHEVLGADVEQPLERDGVVPRRAHNRHGRAALHRLAVSSFGACSMSRTRKSKPEPAAISVASGLASIDHKPIWWRRSRSARFSGFAGSCMEVLRGAAWTRRDQHRRR